MTQGGPVHATELFVYAIYEQIFLNLRVGRASALTVRLRRARLRARALCSCRALPRAGDRMKAKAPRRGRR